MLIGDLRTAMDRRVMPPDEIRAAIAANGLTAPIFSTQLKNLKTPIPATYLLLNDVTEIDNLVVWKARLVQADRGYVEAAWQFQQHVSQLAQMKDQVIAAVVQQTVGGPPVQTPPASDLPAVMAFSRELEAADRIRGQVSSEAKTPRDKGFLSLSQGKDQQAVEHFKGALRQNPDDAEVLLALSRIEQAQGRYQQAKSYAEQAQRLQPERAAPWAALGEIAKAEGRAGDAQQSFEKARQLDATQPEVHRALAELYERAGNQAEAGKAYREAGMRYRKSLNPEAALQAFDKAKTMAPRDASVLLQEGDLHALAGRTDRAQDAYMSAKALTPNNAQVYQKLGELASQVGERNKALVNYEKAIRLQPQHGTANLKLGDLHLKAGRPNKAIPYLEQARQSLPGHVGLANRWAVPIPLPDNINWRRANINASLASRLKTPTSIRRMATHSFNKAITARPSSSMARRSPSIQMPRWPTEDSVLRTKHSAVKRRRIRPLPRHKNSIPTWPCPKMSMWCTPGL